MLFLGTLSVLQLTLFPGLLLIRRFPAKRSVIQNWAYVFMLSLLSNYVVIFLLTAVGLYTRTVLMVLFALEMGALLWFYRDALTTQIGGFGARLKQSIAASLKSFSEWLNRDALTASLYFICGVAAVLAILWLVNFFVNNLDTVWQTYDAWASWDRWAEKWADNRFPNDTWEYPQLIPASYSLTYKFIGTVAVKFFSKSFMPLFSLMIVLMFFDLGRERKSFGYMLSAALSLHLIYVFLGDYIGDGYVDIPVACFSLMAVYTLLKARRIEDRGELTNTLWIGALATAAAGVTKQTGLYLAAFYPVLAYVWILREREDFDTRQALTLLAKQVGVVVLLVVPWYAVALYRIRFGGNSSNIQYVISDIYEGQTLPERFVSAVLGLGRYAYLYAFALISLIVLKSRFRQILLFVILPFSVLWALFLSYEHRNLAVALPLLALVVGVSAEAWITRLSASAEARPESRVPSFALLGVLVLALAAGTLALDSETLIQHQLSEQRQIFRSSLNDEIYRYFNHENGPEPVITSYVIGWLPGLEHTWILERFDDYDRYQATLKSHPDVELLLVPLLTVRDPLILEEIQANIDSGLYTLIFTESDHMMVRIPPRK